MTQVQSFKSRLMMTPEQTAASKVPYAVNKIARKFDADIDANQSHLEDLQEQLENEKNNASCSPVKLAELVVEIKSVAEVVEVLRTLKAELFPVEAV